MTARIPALTIWRPWTTCILRHGKTIENRLWSTNYRGPLWIHAGKRFDLDALDFAEGLGVTLSPDPADHPTGIVAMARLIDICPADINDQAGCDCGPWGVRGVHHWALTDIRAVTPVPCNGAQGLWWPPTNLTDQAAFEVAHA